MVKNVQLEVSDGLDIPEMKSVKGMEVICKQRPGSATSGYTSPKKLQSINDPLIKEKAGPAEQTPQQKGKGAR
jgi:hypothetical protein